LLRQCRQVAKGRATEEDKEALWDKMAEFLRADVSAVPGSQHDGSAAGFLG
jgi:hypothetical protein